MDPYKLTERSQAALATAQRDATRMGHQEVDGEHLLLALLQEPDGLASRLLGRLQIDLPLLRSELESHLAARPRVSGTTVEMQKLYITPRLQRLLTNALDEAEHLKDEYVSIELDDQSSGGVTVHLTNEISGLGEE